MYGQLAQLVEQRIENPRVLGSIPRLATSNTQSHLRVAFSLGQSFTGNGLPCYLCPQAYYPHATFL